MWQKFRATNRSGSAASLLPSYIRPVGRPILRRSTEFNLADRSSKTFRSTRIRIILWTVPFPMVVLVYFYDLYFLTKMRKREMNDLHFSDIDKKMTKTQVKVMIIIKLIN